MAENSEPLETLSDGTTREEKTELEAVMASFSENQLQAFVNLIMEKSRRARVKERLKKEKENENENAEKDEKNESNNVNEIKQDCEDTTLIASKNDSTMKNEKISEISNYYTIAKPFGSIFDNENDISEYQLILDTIKSFFIQNMPYMPNEIACIISEFATGKLDICILCQNERKEILLLQGKFYSKEYQLCKKLERKRNQKYDKNKLSKNKHYVCDDCAKILEKDRMKCEHCKTLCLTSDCMVICENNECVGNLMSDGNINIVFRICNDCKEDVKCIYCWKVTCPMCHGLCEICGETDPKLCLSCYHRCANFVGNDNNNNSMNNNNNNNNNNGNSCNTQMCTKCIKNMAKCQECRASICDSCINANGNRLTCQDCSH